MTFDQYKKHLKDLIGDNQIGEFFDLVKQDLVGEGDHYNALIGLQGQWQRAKQEKRDGTLSLEKLEELFNRLNRSLFRWADELLPQHFEQPTESSWINGNYHYTCDRVEQDDEFQMLVHPEDEDESTQTTQFFYLHGDHKQAHEALVERFAQDHCGLLHEVLRKNRDSQREPLRVTIEVPVSTNPRAVRIKAINAVMDAFELPRKGLKANLGDLLESEFVKAKMMTDTDIVHILILISDENWHKDITPNLVKLFFEDFCRCDLPESTPRFFFYFGLMYEKQDLQKQQEVEAAIKQAQYGDVLPRLDEVNLKDIESWFSRVQRKLPSDVSPAERVALLFPHQTTVDMADVINTLEKFIQDHNTGRMFGQP